MTEELDTINIEPVYQMINELTILGNNPIIKQVSFLNYLQSLYYLEDCLKICRKNKLSDDEFFSLIFSNSNYFRLMYGYFTSWDEFNQHCIRVIEGKEE